jgi:hypothetical protein
MRLEGTGPYMEAALRLLQFVESRRATGRRFGTDADARWGSFRGDLATVDRIELMIRDANAEWPAGFGARTVFALPGVPEDEPFGARWPSLDPVDAEELWRRVKALPAPATVAATLAEIARAWGVVLAPFEVGAVSPTDRLVITGPSAIAAVIEVFSRTAALDWSEQVVVVATPPAVRQLAAAATALLNLARPVTIVRDPLEPRRGARLVASPDADPTDHAIAQAATAG